MDVSERQNKMDGIINVYKERGYTSHDVVAKLRGIFHQKRIGHTGTLDPEAVGVLPVCLGSATKVCEFLTDKSKVYEARVRLGVVTDTQDMTGKVLSEMPVQISQGMTGQDFSEMPFPVSQEDIQRVVSGFVGECWQTPPMYSAVKVNGKRLYELARQGMEVERKKRKITVHSCDIREFFPETSEFTMEVECSKGTYIRTLCHDIGERLICGAAMASLVRTRVGTFSLAHAFTLSQIEEWVKAGMVEKIVVPTDRVFEQYPKVIVTQDGIRFLQNGNKISQSFCRADAPVGDGGTVRMYGQDDQFYALYRYDEKAHFFTNVKMFYNAAGH